MCVHAYGGVSGISLFNAILCANVRKCARVGCFVCARTRALVGAPSREPAWAFACVGLRVWPHVCRCVCVCVRVSLWIGACVRARAGAFVFVFVSVSVGVCMRPCVRV